MFFILQPVDYSTKNVLPHRVGPRGPVAPEVLWPPADGHGQAETLQRSGGNLHRQVRLRDRSHQYREHQRRTDPARPRVGRLPRQVQSHRLQTFQGNKSGFIFRQILGLVFIQASKFPLRVALVILAILDFVIKLFPC